MKKSDTEKEIARLKNALEQKKNENKKLRQQVKYAMYGRGLDGRCGWQGTGS